MNEATDIQTTEDPARCAAPVGSGWIATNDEMPKKGKKVLVCGQYPGGTRWRTTAEWYPAKTMDCSMWDDPPDEYWDENEENCLYPTDAWWETKVEGEELYTLDGVTHWMPLPPFPNDTAHTQKGRERGPDNTQD